MAVEDAEEEQPAPAGEELAVCPPGPESPGTAARRARELAALGYRDSGSGQKRGGEAESKVLAAMHHARFSPGLRDQTLPLGAAPPATARFAREAGAMAKLLGDVPSNTADLLQLLESAGVEGVDLREAPLAHPELRVLAEVVAASPRNLRYLDLRSSLDVRGSPLYPRPEVEKTAARLEAEHVAKYGPIEEGGEEEEANVALEKLKERLTAETGEEFGEVDAAFRALARAELCRTDRMLDALAANKSLTYLSLAGNGLGWKDDGGRTFKQIRRARNVVDDHPALRVVDLSDNRMGPKGTGTLLKGVINNITITDINLGGNGLGEEDEGEEDELEQEDDPAFGEPLVGPYGIADLLKKNKFVRAIRLRENALKCAVEPPEMPQPEPEEEGQAPPPIPDDWDALTDEHKEDTFCKMVLPLSKYQRLTLLDLARNELGVGGAYVLSAVLRTNHSLTSLNLGENQLGPGGVKVLAEQLAKGTGSLRRLGLARNGFAGFKSKKKNKLTLAAVEALCDLFRSDRNNLEELDLAYNNLGPEYGARLVNALADGPAQALRTLDLEMNQLAGTTTGEYSAEGVTAVCGLLSKVPVADIRLQWNFLQPEGAEAVAEALKCDNAKKHLKVLDLSRNYLGERGTELIAAAITDGHSLADLRFAANGAGGRGAVALATMLAQAGALRSLDVSNNALEKESARLLAAAARSCLLHLNVASNSIGSGEMGALCDLVRGCKTLRSLDAGDNEWGSHSVVTGVLPALRDNKALRRLAVWGGEHGTEQSPTTRAELAEAAAKELTGGAGAGLIDLDLGLPLVQRDVVENAAVIADQLRKNLIAAEFKTPAELAEGLV
eukprot:TRINITY_DN14548_c0_g3_i1.p1 TRINITY_DN14548_c0_g3~~TRINITY_DN14548_c0_g3_i1.p1  ORF type:complete len:840 (+),score=337.81 TRINITY_DN14548_c0_g3_i1:100-2619(+)